MSGNVKIGDQGSEPIHMRDRKSRREDLTRMFHSINKHSGHTLWGFGMPSIANSTAFSGSTKHMMSKELKDEELNKYKKSFGDVDVMVPSGSEEKVKAALEPGTKHGKFTVVGSKKIGAQISAVMKHDDGKHHQVDFEFKPFDSKTQEPTPFSQFSQNSHIDDLKKGIKGVLHKHLLSALTAKEGKEGYIEKVKKGESTYSKGQIRSQTFAPTHGMRQKHLPSLDASGKQKMHNGLPVYNEMGSENAKYETDLSKIHENMFGKEGTDSDIEKMSSFLGVAKLMKKHYEPHQIRTVINDFARRIYDKSAGGRAHNDDTKDNDMKVTALRELRHTFPEHFDKLMYDRISDYRKKYYKKEDKPVNEQTDISKTIVFAAGRFTGPSKEHEKLLDETFKQPGDYHYVYVMGPTTSNQTTNKDPLTISEKITYLRKLYPEHASSFIAGDTQLTKTPNQAMAHAWHKHMDEGVLHLTVVAGDGYKGVTGKDAGGSAGAYEDIINRLNKTTYPVRLNEDNQEVGGDYRMNYETVKIIRNPRGTISGTIIREAACAGNPNNSDDISNFRNLLHSEMTALQAKRLMTQIKTRMMTEQAAKIEDVIGEHYEIVEDAASNYELPVEIIETIVEGARSTEEMQERIKTLRCVLREDNQNLLATNDTFVVMYHPEKLYYQIERIKLMPNERVDKQPVIAARLAQGFVITAIHDNTDVSTDTAARYHMRRYRRQIDD